MMMFFQFYFILLKRKLIDLSFSPAICRTRAILFFYRYKLLKVFFPPAAFRFLEWAHLSSIKSTDGSKSSYLVEKIENTLVDEFFKARIVPVDHRKNGNISKDMISFLLVSGGIVLKSPHFDTTGRLIGKGVILLKFYQSFMTFQQCVNMPSVIDHYVLILEPGWSGYAGLLGMFKGFLNETIVVMAPEKHDYRLLEKMSPRLIPIAIGPGDWVNPEIFKPLDNMEKQYDAVMIARWERFKRHHILFRSLREINDASFRVALVSLSPNKRNEIEMLARGYGVQFNLHFFEKLSQKDLNTILNRSKVNLLLSLQEGGNRSLFEGLFAGVPAIALKNNIGINKTYFTDETGRLIDEGNLVSEILYFRNNWPKYHPRTWAMKNITPEISTRRLNDILKKHAKKRGEPWTTDIVAKCNSPNLAYYPDDSVAKDLPTMTDVLMRYAGTEEIREKIRISSLRN